jgi:signal transduction histidine kinase
LPHLFAPLYRSESSRNRQTGGAGLGLTIARRILLAHGGDVCVTNGAGGGAEVTGWLLDQHSLDDQGREKWNKQADEVAADTGGIVQPCQDGGRRS